MWCLSFHLACPTCPDQLIWPRIRQTLYWSGVIPTPISKWRYRPTNIYKTNILTHLFSRLIHQDLECIGTWSENLFHSQECAIFADHIWHLNAYFSWQRREGGGILTDIYDPSIDTKMHCLLASTLQRFIFLLKPISNVKYLISNIQYPISYIRYSISNIQ